MVTKIISGEVVERRKSKITRRPPKRGGRIRGNSSEKKLVGNREYAKLALARTISGPALDAAYVTNGVAHARLLAQKGCRVCLPGGLLRPQTEAIIGAAALQSLQQYNFTKAFMGANGVALDAGFTTPDPEEAAVKAAAVRRARELRLI